LVKIGKKYINLPITGRILTKGTECNNLIFIGYIVRKSTVKEKWSTKEAWVEQSIKEVLRSAKRRAKLNKLPFNITYKYLKSIFPQDGMCPIFFTTLGFSLKDRFQSASLDRILPECGYIKGNVQWISLRANTIKNNAHPFELMRVARYLVKQLNIKI
jgi:hypothetical protein